MTPVEAFGLFAVVIMVASYALERRSHWLVLSFAAGCALAAIYAALIGSLAFMVAESIWAIIALNRWNTVRNI